MVTGQLCRADETQRMAAAPSKVIFQGRPLGVHPRQQLKNLPVPPCMLCGVVAVELAGYSMPLAPSAAQQQQMVTSMLVAHQLEDAGVWLQGLQGQGQGPQRL